MADGINVLLTGVREMVAKIREFKDKFPSHLGRSMYEEVQIEVTECKKRAPVYTGPPGPGKPIPGLLRASIHSEGPFENGKSTRMDIVAGGAAGAYAVPQHENLEYHHEVGEAKYIEGPLFESRPFMLARIAARLKELRKQT